MRQYSIDRVTLAWFGLDFAEGYAPGSTIQEARSAPNWTYKPTGMGRLHRAYNPDKSGTITVTVMQLSKLHQQLLALSQTDEVARNLVAPMVLTDVTSGEVKIFSNTFILTDPDEARMTETTEFQWVFVYEARLKNVPTNLGQNIVGN